MRAKVRLRAIAVAADDISPQPPRSRFERHHRANRITRATPVAGERHRDPVAGRRDVSEQRGAVVLIVDDDVDAAVVVEIAERRAARRPDDGKTASRRGRNLVEPRPRRDCETATGAAPTSSPNRSDPPADRRGRWPRTGRASRRCRSRGTRCPTRETAATACAGGASRSRPRTLPSPRLRRSVLESSEKLVMKVSTRPSLS